MNEGSEQWKEGGNCNVCRRAGYCRKRCSEHKRYMERAIRQVIAESRIGRMHDAIRKTAGTEYTDG